MLQSIMFSNFSMYNSNQKVGTYKKILIMISWALAQYLMKTFTLEFAKNTGYLFHFHNSVKISAWSFFVCVNNILYCTTKLWKSFKMGHAVFEQPADNACNYLQATSAHRGLFTCSWCTLTETCQLRFISLQLNKPTQSSPFQFLKHAGCTITSENIHCT